VRRALRALAALALLVGALAAFGVLQDPARALGRRAWRVLSPLGRRLLPIASVPRAVAFGMIWGWMPCGFVYSLLLIAALQMDAGRGAATMAAFGLGTVPALLATSYGATRIGGRATRPFARRAAGAVLLLSAVMTLAAPWWMESRHSDHAEHLAAHEPLP